MINLQSDGITPVTNAFKTAITGDNRQFLARLMLNSEELDCSIKRLTVTKGSCATQDEFNVGTVIGSTLNAELIGLTAGIKGRELRLDIGLEVDGGYEWITLGTFQVTESNKTAYTTTLTGYGRTVARTGGTFAVPATKSLSEIADSIFNSTGVMVIFDSSIDTAQVVGGSLDGLSNYGALQVLANCVGGYAVDTWDGKIKIVQFKSTATHSVDAGMMLNLPEVEEEDFEVTGLKVIVREKTDEDAGLAYEQGVANLIVSNAYETQAMFNNVTTAIIGYKYRPAVIGLSMGDPRIEGNDVLAVTDVNGNTYTVPCHQVVHTYDGGLSTQIIAVKATPQDLDIGSYAPITRQLDIINASAINAQLSADSAKQSALDAQHSADQASASASTALTKAQEAVASADTAERLAGEAKTNADTANRSANTALTQLSVVEDVVDTLDWITEHGTYTATTDTTVQAGKVYYTRTGTGTEQDPYVYTAVVDPTGNPQAQSWYELTIDEAVSNYVNTHLSLTNDGLWVLGRTIGADQDYKVLLAPDGMKVYDASGNLVSTFGESVTFSSDRAQYIGGTNAYIVFNPTTGTLNIGGSVLFNGNLPLNELLAQLETLYTFDIECAVQSGIATLEAHLWSGKTDMRSSYPPTAFRWILRSEAGDTTLGTGYTWVQNMDTIGYASSIVCQFKITEDYTLVTQNGDPVITQSGDRITVAMSAQTFSREVTLYENGALDNSIGKAFGGLGGYVYLKPNSAGFPEEILIMDSPDIAQAVNVWRFNKDGLAHSSNGYNGSYSDIALTQDGEINANLITVGTLTDQTGENYWNLNSGQFVTTQGNIGPFSLSSSGLKYSTILESSGRGYLYELTSRGFRSMNCSNYGSYGNRTAGVALIRDSNSLPQFAFYDKYFSSGIDDSTQVGTISGSVNVGTESDVPTISIVVPGHSFSFSRLGFFCGGAGNFQSDVTIFGNLSVSGTKPRLVKTPNYGERLNYCYETPTPLFGDIGEAQLDSDGICYVDIDDIFSETIELRQEYQVFLQKEGEGDCWIADKQKRYFVIQGTPNLKVAWELKAKQRDYDMIRLEQADNGLDEYGHITNGDSLLDAYINEQEELLYG